MGHPEALEPHWDMLKNNVMPVHERVIDLGGKWYSSRRPVTSEKQVAGYIQNKWKLEYMWDDSKCKWLEENLD
jgi:hypothetical protein